MFKTKGIQRILFTVLIVCAFLVSGVAMLVTPVLAADEIVWEYSTGLDYPSAADRLTNGNTLISDSINNRVIEVDPLGNIVWEYNTGLNLPVDAERLPDGNTLIADAENNRVIEVNPVGNIVWEYSAGLYYVYDVERLSNGNTLITNLFDLGLIEVDPAGNIVWEYDMNDKGCPIDSERLASGNTLITNNCWNMITEITPAGEIDWSYNMGLSGPIDAERLPNGNTLISDHYNNRVIEVDPDRNIVWEYNTGLNGPLDAERLSNGNTLIADCHRVIEVGTPPQPISVDLRATGGDSADIIDVAGYSVSEGDVTEDGITVDKQTAMGVLICYCQEYGIEILITESWGAYVVQIGVDPANENMWMYAYNESVPMVGADAQPVGDGDSVHWFNYLLGYYQMLLSVDKTEILPGDDITATVTWTDGYGTVSPVENAGVFVSDTWGGWEPAPGTLVDYTDGYGELTFTWNDAGHFWPYAEIDTRTSIHQYPAPEFYCAFAWDVNFDGGTDMLDLLLVAQHFDETGTPGWIREDVNDDGVVNLNDLILIAQHWGS